MSTTKRKFRKVCQRVPSELDCNDGEIKNEFFWLKAKLQSKINKLIEKQKELK